MIPLRLQLSNFMSYRSTTTVDFRAVRTACLSGENGAGKSALLEAMTWAVWGKCRSSSGRDIVTVGETQVEVTFDLQLGDQEYRVFRRQSVGARTTTTLEFFVRPAGSEDEDAWRSITADTARATDRKIVATLKLDYDTFVNSAFLMQGQADAFTEKPPQERKKVLANILNLGDYDLLSSMAREEERSFRARVHQFNGQIERIEQRLESRPDVERELETLSARLIDSGNHVESLETELRTVQETLSAMSTLLRTRDATQARLERLQLRLTQLKQQNEADSRTLNTLAALISRGEEIEANYKSLQKWRDIREKQAAILRERQPLETRLRGVERDIDRARAQQQRRIDTLSSTIKQLEQTLTTMSARQEELDRLNQEVAAGNDVTRDLEQARQSLRAYENERATLQAECKSLRASMNEIKENMVLLETGDAECPVCRRPLSDGEHDHVATLWKKEGTALGDTYRAHGARIKELDELTRSSTENIRKLEREQALIADRQTLMRRIAEELKEQPEVESALETHRADLNSARCDLEQGRVAADLLSEAGDLQASLSGLHYDENAAAEADANVRKLATAEAEHLELQTALVRHANVTEALNARAADLQALETESDAMADELKDMAAQLADEPALRKRYATRTDELERARADRDQVQSRFGAVTGMMAELDRLKDEATRLRKDRDEVTMDADANHELAAAFGRNGIQAMIVETILPELEDEANRLLARMTSSHLHVRFRSTRQAVSNDNIIETLDIVIRDEAGERPYALYSGGEAFRVDFAIRVALSKLLARRAGTTIDMLIIDEGFGTQDARGRDGLIEALRTVEQDFATILVITHIDEVREMFPTRIEVTKTESGSAVMVA